MISSTLLSLSLALWAPPANAAVETRLGLLLPEQVHDGANLHLAFNGRWLLGWVDLLAEVGLDRTTLTGLTTAIPTPYGAFNLRADAQVWAVPLLAGFALSWTDASGGGHLDLLGGGAWSYRRLTTKVVEGALLSDEARQAWRPLVRGRLGWRWSLETGELLFGGGWQHVFSQEIKPTSAPVSIEAMSITGVLLEAGWRARF